MRIEEGKIKDLVDRGDRAIAKLARIARNDTVFGGCRAIVLADRLEAMGTRLDARAVVGHVYRSSSGQTPPEYKACLCPECGQTVLGEEVAMQCCAFIDEPEQEFIDEDDDESEDFPLASVATVRHNAFWDLIRLVVLAYAALC